MSVILNRKDVVFLLTKAGWGKAGEKDDDWLLAKVRNLPKQVEDEGYDRIIEGMAPAAVELLNQILNTTDNEFTFGPGVMNEKPSTAGKKTAVEAPAPAENKGAKKVMSSKATSNGKIPHQIGIEMIDLRHIVANTAQSRGMGVLYNLEKEGYGLFEKLQPDSQAEPIWSMLLSEDPKIREEVVFLMEKHQPAEVAISIGMQENGQLEPIGVLKLGDSQYDVIYGMRRAIGRAILFARDPKKYPPLVEAKVFTGKMSETDLVLLALEENGNREGETPMDKAKTYKRLRDQGVSAKEIGERTGQSQQTVNAYLRLLHHLLEDKWDAIHTGKISAGRALKILERRQKGREAAREEANGSQRHRLPTVKGIIKILEMEERPKGMTAKEWELWNRPDVRKFFAYKLGIKVPERELAGAK